MKKSIYLGAASIKNLLELTAKIMIMVNKCTRSFRLSQVIKDYW